MELEADDRARERQFAALFTLLRPDPDAWRLWLNAMASGDYTFGYGLLRSAEDEYDPCGVLIALDGGEWVWDEAEEAWAHAGSAIQLAPHIMERLLGCRKPKNTPLDGYDQARQALPTLVSALADTASDFGPIVKVLSAAQGTSVRDHERLKEALHAMTDLRGPNEVGDTKGYTERWMSRSPFYAR